MDLDAPLDITIGPYETYNDEIFGYKASYEAYVNLRDDKETDKLKFFSGHMQEIEDNLPLDAKFRNSKICENCKLPLNQTPIEQKSYLLIIYLVPLVTFKTKTIAI